MNRPEDSTWRLIRLLGYAGLIPFVFLSLSLWLVGPDLHPYVALAMQGYGAAIVSFLGGIHWGVGFRNAITMHKAPAFRNAITMHKAPAFHFVWGDRALPAGLGGHDDAGLRRSAAAGVCADRLLPGRPQDLAGRRAGALAVDAAAAHRGGQPELLPGGWAT